MPAAQDIFLAQFAAVLDNGVTCSPTVLPKQCHHGYVTVDEITFRHARRCRRAFPRRVRRFGVGIRGHSATATPTQHVRPGTTGAHESTARAHCATARTGTRRVDGPDR